MVKLGWVLTWVSALKHDRRQHWKIVFHPAQLLSEMQRLGESDSYIITVGILQFTVALVYLIPRTSILGAILMTGFLGGAETLQTRVSGSGAFLITLPLFLGVLAWVGIWLRDERLRDLIPLRMPLSPRGTGLPAASSLPSDLSHLDARLSISRSATAPAPKQSACGDAVPGGRPE